MIQIKSPREIEIMARGGEILAATVRLLEQSVRPGMTTMDLDKIADDFIRSHPGAIPAFKGLYNFPASICTSINNEIVHGIPSRKRVLVEGDIVSVDVGVKYEGYHTDSATTVAVGEIPEESRRLLAITREALDAGVQAAMNGNHLGDIGAAVQQVVERAGFSVVRDLVGHGIGTGFHEEPQVPNYGRRGSGPRLKAGMTLAIEPMINSGTASVKLLDDGWTVCTADGMPSAHFEHTVLITREEPEILTWRGKTQLK
jgi:methionyl aminopeptidase